MTGDFVKKMENLTEAEAVGLHKPNYGKLRLIGTAIGVIVVIVLAVWMAHL
jgi:hypothetical protein